MAKLGALVSANEAFCILVFYILVFKIKRLVLASEGYCPAIELLFLRQQIPIMLKGWRSSVEVSDVLLFR